MALLEEIRVGREPDLAMTDAVAEPDLTGGERLAVVEANEPADPALVEPDHHSPSPEPVRGPANERLVFHRETKRHVVALNERARIHGRELEEHHTAARPQPLEVPDADVSDGQHHDPGDDRQHLTHDAARMERPSARHGAVPSARSARPPRCPRGRPT